MTFGIIDPGELDGAEPVSGDIHLLASDTVKERLGANFEQLAERHNISIFVVSANDVFPRAKSLIEGMENPARSSVVAAVTDSYRSFASEFYETAPDIVDNIRGGIFADQFRQGMMAESLYEKNPVGKAFKTDSGHAYGVIVVPPLGTPREALAGYELNIDTQYFTNLPGESADWMNWVIEHEATHVGRMHLNTGKDVQVLQNEIEADNGTYQNAAALEQEGHTTPMEIVQTVARLRSLNAVLTPVDNNHATGPAIGPDFDGTPEDVIAATQAVRLKIHSHIAVTDGITLEDASRLAVDEPERAIGAMKTLAGMNAFTGDHLQERIASLGIEAADMHLSPGFEMDFNSSDIDAFIERQGLARNEHIYGQADPDPQTVYANLLNPTEERDIPGEAAGAPTAPDVSGVSDESTPNV